MDKCPHCQAVEQHAKDLDEMPEHLRQAYQQIMLKASQINNYGPPFDHVDEAINALEAEAEERRLFNPNHPAAGDIWDLWHELGEYLAQLEERRA